MREIINIQLGQAGNNIGYQFISNIAQEHHINPEAQHTPSNQHQHQNIDVFFKEQTDSFYTSRTILVDLEPGTIDRITGLPFAGLFNCDNFKVGMGSAGNNFAVGRYGKGSELIQCIIDAVRNQADDCDQLQGFQIAHSTAGGTGSGLGTLILQKLKEEYASKITQTFTLLPSANHSQNILEVYNTILAFSTFVQQVQMCNVLSNDAMKILCEKKQNKKKVTYKDINDLVSHAMSGLTCGLRFAGQINSSLRKIATNLVPYPRIHFFVNSISPFIPSQKDMTRKFTEREMIVDLFDPPINLSGVKRYDGRYITASTVIRGNASTYGIESHIRKTVQKNCSYFVEWIQNQISCSFCDVSYPNYEKSGVMASNNSAIVKVYKDLCEGYNKMFRKKAYVHWYTGEGMDEMEFVEAESNMNDLCSEYDWNNGGCSLCGEEEDQEAQNSDIQ